MLRGNWLIAAALVALAGCQAQPGTHGGDLLGHASKYTSQLGNFTCPAPAGTNPREDSTLDSDQVSFRDSGGLRLRVESFAIAHVLTEAPRGNDEWQERLQTIFYQHVMGKEFLRRSLKASVASEDYIDSPVGKAYFAAVSVPAGSSASPRRAEAAGDEDLNFSTDSAYGVLVFPARGYLYVITIRESSVPASQDAGLPQSNLPASAISPQQTDHLQKTLKQIAADMTFK